MTLGSVAVQDPALNGEWNVILLDNQGLFNRTYGCSMQNRTDWMKSEKRGSTELRSHQISLELDWNRWDQGKIWIIWELLGFYSLAWLDTWETQQDEKMVVRAIYQVHTSICHIYIPVNLRVGHTIPQVTCLYRYGFSYLWGDHRLIFRWLKAHGFNLVAKQVSEPFALHPWS